MNVAQYFDKNAFCDYKLEMPSFCAIQKNLVNKNMFSTLYVACLFLSKTQDTSILRKGSLSNIRTMNAQIRQRICALYAYIVRSSVITDNDQSLSNAWSVIVCVF